MALDSHTYGFTLQELSWPFEMADAQEMAVTMAQRLPRGEYPNFVAMTEMVSATPERASLDFEFGLDLILDGLDRLRPTRDRTRLTSR
jgi:hypothetical protein